MKPEAIKRRLAAILAADVAGYSRLMGADEEATLRALTEYRAAMAACIQNRAGRVVGTAGDALLAEFASVADAVTCAAEIQQDLGRRNADQPEARRLEFRIGIHLDDVIVADDDIYGDGVNIAARLQEMGEPGGICVSGTVHDSVRNKLSFDYEAAGEQSFKNIAEPVRAFHLREGARAQTPAAAAVDSQPHRPSLAVLPFDNLGGDPEQEYFADGITEDLITEFSRFQELIVIARNSVFSYKGKAVRVQDVGRELGVRYVLEGSVRKAGARVRITAQLVDAASGHHLWAERYDREIEDVFAVQDEVTRKIVATLAGKLDATERRRARGESERTENLEAYDLVLRGRELWHRFTPEDNLAARRLYEKAVELDPDYARAYASLAWTYLQEAWSSGSDEALKRALEYARKGVRINPASHSNYLTLGQVCLSNGLTDQAVEAIERGIEINPNDSDGLGFLAQALSMQGKPDEAIARIDEAVRNDPNPRQWHRTQTAIAHFIARRYSESVEAMEGLGDPPDWAATWYAPALAQLGREDEAKKVIEEFLRRAPPFAYKSRLRGFKFDEDRQHYAEALRKAGLEGESE